MLIFKTHQNYFLKCIIYIVKSNYDVVLARRKKREGETFVKKVVSSIGYYLINKLTDIEIPRNTGDFRLMRKKVTELKKLNETHGFLRGLISFIGFNQTFIEYD